MNIYKVDSKTGTGRDKMWNSLVPIPVQDYRATTSPSFLIAMTYTWIDVYEWTEQSSNLCKGR